MKENATYDGRGNLLQSEKYKNRKKEGIGTAAHTAKEIAAHNDRLNRFHGSHGHGYAAEQGNDLIDRLKGKMPRYWAITMPKTGQTAVWKAR